MTGQVQIKGGWEISPDLSEIEDLFSKTHPYMLPLDVLTGGSYEWAEEIATNGILLRLTHAEIVKKIFDGYDPTPDTVEIGYFF